MEGDQAIKPLLHEKYAEVIPLISPDGRWIVYETDDPKGEFNVYVRPFPNVNDGGKYQITFNGGRDPLWSPDGQKIFYYSRGSLWEIAIEMEPEFIRGEPVRLFQCPYNPVVSMGFNYAFLDIDPDGKRFLGIQSIPKTNEESPEEPPTKINVVVNWFEELKQKVPTP